jgi:hypothetical protein
LSSNFVFLLGQFFASLMPISGALVYIRMSDYAVLRHGPLLFPLIELKAFSTHLTSIIKLPNHVAAHYDFTE